MTSLTWALLGLLVMFLLTALGDLVSEEIRGWLDLAPRAILRLAATRLGPELREAAYQEEWVPELAYILRGAESRPITRLIRGTSFALGLLFSVSKIAQYRVPAVQPTVAPPGRPASISHPVFPSPANSSDSGMDAIVQTASGEVFAIQMKAGRGWGQVHPKPGRPIPPPRDL